MDLEETHHLDSFNIRPLNPDNIKDVRRLIDLFHSHYRSRHPIPGVFEDGFWTVGNRHTNRKSQITSLVAEKGKRFYAHLAFQIDYQAATAQLMLPAIAPDYRESLFSVVRLFWSRIEKVAQRQAWRAVLTYCPSTEPLQQLLAAKCFGANATALVPCRQREFDAAPGSLLSMVRTLTAGRQDRLLTYVPETGQAFAKKLFSSLELKRELAFSSTPVLSPITRGSSRPLSIYNLKAYNTLLIRLRPSEFTESKEVWRKITNFDLHAKNKNQVAVFQLSAQDPRSLALAYQLEDIGYTFSGITPLAMPDDVLVYTRAEPSILRRSALYTPLARELRELIYDDKTLDFTDNATSTHSRIAPGGYDRHATVMPTTMPTVIAPL